MKIKKSKPIRFMTPFLMALLWIQIGCQDNGYLWLGHKETIRTKMRGQIDSIVIDFEQRAKTILKINNDGKKISFPVFAMWVDSKNDGKVRCQPMDTGYFCDQNTPAQFDSVFKDMDSEYLEVREHGSNTRMTIKIVELELANKVTEVMTTRNCFPADTVEDLEKSKGNPE